MNDETNSENNDTPPQNSGEVNESSAAADAASETAAAPASSSGFSLGTVIDDAKRVLTDPTGFYRGMATKGGYADPIIFVAVMGAIVGILMTVFSLFSDGRFGLVQASGWAFIVMPIMAVIGSFIGGGIMFIIWKLMGGETDFESAYRSVAYSTAIYPVSALVGIIPYVGTIVAVLWGLYLLYNATIEVHKIPADKAKIVFVILAVLGLWSQLTAERAARQVAERLDAVGESVEEFSGAMEQLGERLDSEDYEDRAEAIAETAEKLGVSLEERFGDSLKELENIDEMEPEEAGRKLGEFFKELSEGMEEFEKGFEEGAQGAGSN